MYFRLFFLYFINIVLAKMPDPTIVRLFNLFYALGLAHCHQSHRINNAEFISGLFDPADNGGHFLCNHTLVLHSIIIKVQIYHTKIKYEKQMI